LYSPTEFDDPNALSHLFEDAERFGKEVFGSSAFRQRPLTLSSVVDDMRARDTLSTNSGFPRFTRRQRVQQQEVQDAETGKAYDYPAIILFRHYYGKLRPVWMFPMSTNLIEMRFQQAIQARLKQSPLHWVREYLSPWEGFDRVKQVLTEQWKGQQVDGGDTTKMDAHMRRAQITLVFHIVKILFQKQYWEELYRSLIHICEIPLLISETQQIEGIHGLASGSAWTQITETVLQLFMCWKLKSSGQGIGDDFYWFSQMQADELVNYLGEFGLPANPAKQGISSTELGFLQRLFRRGFFSRDDSQVLGAYYPTIRALNSMINPEKFHKPSKWNSNMFCIRNYMILENCIDDPCFPEFLKFVVRGHRDMIPFAKKSARELDDIQNVARQVPGLSPSYNQEKLGKPLSSFTSIKMAREL
jgi:hypothetical protein